MTATQTQIRRGTNAQCNAMTPASSEVIHDTSNNRTRNGDGSRQGGWVCPNFSDIQKQAFTYAVAGGTGNAVTLAYGIATIGDVDGLELSFKATATNTGAMTIAVDGRAAAAFKKISGGSVVDMESGDCVNGNYYKFVRLGSIYICVSGIAEATPAAGWELLTVANASGASVDFTSLIDTSYKNYIFMLNNVMPSNPGSGVSLNMRVRRSGQGSFDSGAANYYYKGTTSVGGTTATSILLNSGDNPASMSGGFSGVITAHSLAIAIRAQFDFETICGGSNTSIEGSGVGSRLTTTALDGVQFFPDGSVGLTWVSGTILMYGIKSAL